MKVIFFVLFLLLLVNVGNAQILKKGNNAVDFYLKNTTDSIYNLNMYKGKVVLIDFWASWCPPCRKELPYINKIHKQYEKLGLVVIGISVDENKLKWLSAIKKYKLNYLNLIENKSASISDLYGVSYIPTIFLIDKKGIIIGSEFSHSELERKIKAALKN